MDFTYGVEDPEEAARYTAAAGGMNHYFIRAALPGTYLVDYIPLCVFAVPFIRSARSLADVSYSEARSALVPRG